MPGERFTAWIGEDERELLRRVAADEGCSENFVMRSALRALLFGTETKSFQRMRETASQIREATNSLANHVTGAR